MKENTKILVGYIYIWVFEVKNARKTITCMHRDASLAILYIIRLQFDGHILKKIDFSSESNLEFLIKGSSVSLLFISDSGHRWAFNSYNNYLWKYDKKWKKNGKRIYCMIWSKTLRFGNTHIH